MYKIYDFTYEELFEMAFTDELTQIANYRKFKYSLQEQIELSYSENKPFAILFMDINHFKQVNDKHGHSTGDKLLIECSSILKRIANRYDEQVFRKSGDEFLLLVQNIEHLFHMIHDIQHKLQNPLHINEKMIRCQMSIGYSIYPIHGQTEEELFDYADKKMYLNKEQLETIK